MKQQVKCTRSRQLRVRGQQRSSRSSLRVGGRQRRWTSSLRAKGRQPSSSRLKGLKRSPCKQSHQRSLSRSVALKPRPTKRLSPSRPNPRLRRLPPPSRRKTVENRRAGSTTRNRTSNDRSRTSSRPSKRPPLHLSRLICAPPPLPTNPI